MATEPNVQLLGGGECLRNITGEELRVNYILKIGRIVGYDVKDSFDDIPGTKSSKRWTTREVDQLTVFPASGVGDLQRHPKRRRLLSTLPRDLG